MDATIENPYVGPRTFEFKDKDRFFGRDREAHDLSALVASDKLVLFYAQSGAGKSSLINTRLMPALKEKDYQVLPVARVSGELSEDFDIDNIYIYNLMRSLIRHEIESSTLAELSLSQFLARLNEDENGDFFYDSSLATDISATEGPIGRRALIIDQFEELFSTHPEAWEKREDFFNQLAQAMQDDPYLWVVLVMREDYIAPLDPYVHLLPGGLRTRYYMQRLSRQAAIKAVRKPVEKMRPYEVGVAEKLVEDLSSIKVQKPDGTQDFQPGQYVEPVQLQVVCYGLWQNLPAAGTHITERDLLDVGDVDEALGKYFAERIAAVARTKNVKERLIRDWIEKKLIAPGGIRSMVLQETDRKSGGISDDVIQALQSDLVRAENRGGAFWYELTHDRLVGPILENNKKWFDENLSPLQRQATLWNDQERNESWLLRDQALAEVENWANENPDELTELETEFLQACQNQQEQFKLKEQARSARRLRRFVAIVGLLGLIAVVAAIAAFRFGRQADSARADAENNLELRSTAQAKAEIEKANADLARGTAQASEKQAVLLKDQAEEQAKIALAGNLAAQSDSLKNSDYPLALLLGIEAYERDKDSLLTRTTLFQLLQFTPYERKFEFNRSVSSVAVSPDGKVIATAGCQTQCQQSGISLFDADLKWIGNIPGNYGVVYSLAFSPDGNTLAAGGCVPSSKGCADSKGQITLWDVTNPETPTPLGDIRSGHTGLVKTLAFSPNAEKKWLASGSYDQTIIIWDISNPEKPPSIGKPLQKHRSFVNSIAFSPDGNTLVSASDDKTILLWNVSTPENFGPIGSPIADHSAPVNSVAFSPDKKKFASSSSDNTVLLWDWDSRSLRKPMKLEGHTGYVTSVAFSADGRLLASAGFDNKIILWDASTGEQIGPPLRVHSGAINSVSFGIRNLGGKESPYLISGSDDRTAIRWDLSTRQPLSYTSNPELDLPPVDTDSNGKLCAKASGPQVALSNGQQVLSSCPPDVFLILDGFDSPVQYVKFDGDDLLTVDQTQKARSQRDRSTPWITSWSIDPSTWVKLACNAVNTVNRTLTPEEMDRYLQGQESISNETCGIVR